MSRRGENSEIITSTDTSTSSQVSNFDGVVLEALWPSGLVNYFVYKRFAVQTLLWSLEFVIQIILEHDTMAITSSPYIRKLQKNQEKVQPKLTKIKLNLNRKKIKAKTTRKNK